MQPSAAPRSRVYRAPNAKTELKIVQGAAAKRGDAAALVASVEGTVRKIASRFRGGLSAEDVEDMYAAGRMGAVVAAQRYDSERGASFNTYATNWIRLYVLREVLFFWSRGRFKVGTSTSKVFFGYARARGALEAAGADASDETVAEILGMTPSTLSAVRAAVEEKRSCDDPLVNGMSLQDVVVDESAVNPLEEACEREGVAAVRDALGCLNERSRWVIEQRFFEERTFAEVGDALGLSRERVRQIERVALAKLHKKLSK